MPWASIAKANLALRHFEEEVANMEEKINVEFTAKEFDSALKKWPLTSVKPGKLPEDVRLSMMRLLHTGKMDNVKSEGGNMMIEFTDAELDEILKYMDSGKFETVQEAILHAIKGMKNHE